MGPDWKSFVDELIDHFQHHEFRVYFGEDLAKMIRDRQIQFLEKALKILDEEEGVEV